VDRAVAHAPRLVISGRRRSLRAVQPRLRHGRWNGCQPFHGFNRGDERVWSLPRQTDMHRHRASRDVRRCRCAAPTIGLPSAARLAHASYPDDWRLEHGRCAAWCSGDVTAASICPVAGRVRELSRCWPRCAPAAAIFRRPCVSTSLRLESLSRVSVQRYPPGLPVSSPHPRPPAPNACAPTPRTRQPLSLPISPPTPFPAAASGRRPPSRTTTSSPWGRTRAAATCTPSCACGQSSAAFCSRWGASTLAAGR